MLNGLADEQKMTLLDNLFQETHISDIVKRNKIRNVGEMEALLDALASAIGVLFYGYGTQKFKNSL